jgi:ankyrin repeat protein
LAIKNTHENLAEMLVAKGADINATNSEGNSPLHLALKNGANRLISFFAYNGANLNQPNPELKTPFAIANEMKNEAAAKVIWEHGGR